MALRVSDINSAAGNPTRGNTGRSILGCGCGSCRRPTIRCRVAPSVEAMTGVAVPRGAVHQDERALAPDLARGVMLLLIVMSNTAFHLWGSRHGPSGWHPVDGSWLDRAVQFVMIVTLDLRAYPLFAFLL